MFSADAQHALPNALLQPAQPMPIVEEDEDGSAPATPAAVPRQPAQDLEQTLSAALAARDYTPMASPRPASTICAPVSASPAAAFLSFFNSPAPEKTANPDDEGQVVAGYTLGPIIGYGSTSIIRRATSSSGTQAAVKIIRRADLVKAGNAPQARKKLEHEAAVWSTLSHEHILPLFSVVHHTYADYFFTLYCPAGSLLDILNRDGSPALPQDDAGMMLRQVVRGLRYLHEIAGYVHRDLKLENVLVDEMGVCKIGDFGLSRRIDSNDDTDDDQEAYPSFGANNPTAGVQRAVSLAGPPSKRLPRSHHAQLNHHHHAMMRHNSARHRNSTSTNEPVHFFQPGSLPYAAPELLLPQTSEGRRAHPSQDIWALGVMLYALLTGRLPFTDSFEPRLQMKILNGYYTVPPGIGKGAERILAGCLKSSVQERWTIAMVDEVSWGVGWGAEGDEAAAQDEHTNDDDECPPLPSRSRSHSRPPASAPGTSGSRNSDWQLEEPLGRGSREAASRRSTSRAQRSLSRAPLLPGRQDSSRSVSRHPPRSRSPVPASAPAASTSFNLPSHAHGHPPPQPPVPLRTATNSTSSSASTSSFSASSSYLGLPYEQDDDDESALEVSPSPPRTRGRPQSKFHHHHHRDANQAHLHDHSHSASHSHSHSRSPSPSVVPTTPKDGPVLNLSPAGLAEPPEDLVLGPHDHHGHRASHPASARSKSRGRQTTRPSLALASTLDLPMSKRMQGQMSLAEEMMVRSDSFASAASGSGSTGSQFGSDSLGSIHSGVNSGSGSGERSASSSRGRGRGRGISHGPSPRFTHNHTHTHVGGSGNPESDSSVPPRRAASSHAHLVSAGTRRPTSTPPSATGPRKLGLGMGVGLGLGVVGVAPTPPTPLDPFLTPASVTVTPSGLSARSRSAHPRAG